MKFTIDRYFPDSSHESGDAGKASFAEKRPLYLAASKNYVAFYRDEIRKRHYAGAGGEWVVRSLTELMDTLIQKLFQSIVADLHLVRYGSETIALLAIGGYGRGELNPFSDIDLMFLHTGKEGKLVEDVAQKLLYFFWDMRFDIGYSVRTIQDCLEMSRSDLTVRTALLDTRFLVGNMPLFAEFSKIFLAQIVARGSDAFIRDKLEEMKKRRQKYGSSVYILEPNIKESEGGLRDLHTALWLMKIKYKISSPRELVMKGVISEEELATYFSALDYLWRIRNELHYLAGRKNDQLTVEAQSPVAAFFGYSDTGKVLAVEEFMRDYYRHAVKVEHYVSSFVTRCARREEGPLKFLGYFTRRPIGEGFFVVRGELVIPDESIIEQEPARLMKLFESAQKQGVELHLQVKALVRQSLYLVNDKFRRNREVNRSFFAILRSDKGVGETLRLMHHLQLLNRFIPEFEHIYCKVQHDLYHIYTVDTHSLFAVEEIIALIQGKYAGELPLLSRLAAGIEKRELMLLAVLFHDIGKGEGGGHAEKGADMSRTIARRMGLSREDSERLEFLVRNHLLFAHIAQRRDLHDEKMIIQFSRQMGNSVNLTMLYLLTFADLKAVGPEVWTDWKALLLEELFEKTFTVLERGNFTSEARSERIRNMRKVVSDVLSDEFPAQLIKEEMRAMTTRYLLSCVPAAIAGHVRLLLVLEERGLIVQVTHETDKGYSTVTICTHDVPGLFSKITGVMAANGMNILGAQIFTNTNGKVIDILQVNSPQGLLITDQGRWKRMEADLGDVLEGNVRVNDLVEKRRRPSLLGERPKPRVPTRIEVDNEVSEDYSVIDIYTHDKVGLLYRITSTLTDLGLYIGVSKISTKVDQAADVFYIKDIFGHKVMSEEKLAEIQERLFVAIDCD